MARQEQDGAADTAKRDGELKMTPSEFLKIKVAMEQVITDARKKIYDSRVLTEGTPPPRNRRPATPRDIIIGSIIWHERDRDYGGDFWNIVEEVLRPGDAFKAYNADDGCRYGLDGAYIDID